MRRAGRIRIVASAVAVLSTGACVDHRENAVSFCAEVAAVIDAARDHQEVEEEQARATADDFAVAMRHAEDATRPVRKAARRTSVAYDELAALLGDDDPDSDEIAEARHDLQKGRKELRQACAELRPPE